MSTTSPLIVIVGETASGKSALALQIAQQFSGEIICADSATVRRGVTIGTAKPTALEQAQVAHHLLDIIAPDQKFSAADFKTLANQKINEIAKRGNLPVMVGGTGLYIDGVLYDYGFRQSVNASDRESLNASPTEELVERIKSAGIPFGNIDIHNKHRLIRLIETDGQKPTRKALRDNTLVIGFKTDKEILRQRITIRVDAMLSAGLEIEVKGLSEQYGWDCEALKSVGYAQWREYFLDAQTLEETRAKIIKATQDLSKRQRTWFKRNQSIHWLDTPVNQTAVVDLVTTFLDT